MKPFKSSSDGSRSSRERRGNHDLEQAMLDRDELVMAAVTYAFENRREFDTITAVSKVVAEQAELDTPPAEVEVSVDPSLETERERLTAEARRLIDEIQDEHDEPAERDGLEEAA